MPLKFRPFLLAATAALALTVAARADDSAADLLQIAEATTPPPAVKAPAEEPNVDLSALRYFARQGDTERLKTEIARLKALYPSWVPPADPLTAGTADKALDAMWQLYGDGKYSELRQAIAKRQAAEPSWQVPANLLAQLTDAEARQRLLAAFGGKQYATVVEIAATSPGLLTCAEPEVLWDVAESFIRSDRGDRGGDVYGYLLKNCDDAAVRKATVQKAAGLLSYGAMQPLLALERNGEFDSLRDDLARRYVGAADADTSLVIDPAYVDRAHRLADSSGKAEDALLYGWYLWLRDKSPDAGRYFAAARARADSASASQGLALVRIAEGKFLEAEAIMYGWRDTSADAMATYLAATASLIAKTPVEAIDANVLKRIADVVLARRDAATAQQFGWYARAFGAMPLARQWFETALTFKPDDEPSAYGLAVTDLDLKDKGGLASVQAAWASRSPRIAAVGHAVAAQPPPPRPAPLPTATPPVAAPLAYGPITTPAVAPPRPATAQTPRLAAAAPGCGDAAVGGKAASALSQGWCLMDLKRPAAAIASFEAAAASPHLGDRQQAARGKALAYLRLGLINEAALAATGTPLPPAQAAELQIAILGDRAVAAFNGKRFRETILYLDQRAALRDEPVDLMVLRGYAYFRLGRTSDAERIFRAVAATGNRDATRGLNEVMQSAAR